MAKAKAKNNIGLVTLSYILFLFSIAPKNHSFARTITDLIPETHQTTTLTFLMRNVLSGTYNNKPPTTKVTSHQIPFSKPIGLVLPTGGIPTPVSDPGMVAPTTTTGQYSSDTLGASFDAFSFPTVAALQELEIGTVTPIDEEMFKVVRSSTMLLATRVIGKGHGICVASSDDGSSQMMAMAAYFADSEFEDGLRFFGVHRKGSSEWHIAVIGGTGKYSGANGYASVKAVDGNMSLLFTVYLS